MDLEKVGEKFGFVLMFIVSTIILFFVLKVLNKMPDNWGYFNVFLLVLLITLVGIILKKLLK